MKPEQQRIAIAEACGYRKGETTPLWWARPVGQPFKACDIKNLPNYLSDLNAMHEAEKVLFDRNDWSACRFEKELGKLTHGSWEWHATAPQRAEAFLRTLNLWTD